MNITHWAFETMIGIGTLLTLALVGYWALRWWRKHDLLEHSWFLRFCAVTGSLAVIAVEAGWIATEVGRQPRVVYDVMRTTEAAGNHSGLWWLLAPTVEVYTTMTVGAALVLGSMAGRWRQGQQDLPSPYGPQSRLHDEDPARDTP